MPAQKSVRGGRATAAARASAAAVARASATPQQPEPSDRCARATRRTNHTQSVNSHSNPNPRHGRSLRGESNQAAAGPAMSDPTAPSRSRKRRGVSEDDGIASKAPRSELASTETGLTGPTGGKGRRKGKGKAPAVVGWLREVVMSGQFRSVAVKTPTPPEIVRARMAHEAERSLATVRGAETPHTTAVEQFRKQQMERQRVGLQSNTRKHASGAVAEALVSAHEEALEIILALTDVMLSPTLLLAVHKDLCAHDVNADPGEFRTVGVKAGGRQCPPADAVPGLMAQFCDDVNDLLSRHTAGSHTSPVEVLAAAAMLGLTQIHPFRDGNGRMCRLLCNWVLAKCGGAPFPVCLTSSPDQRALYVAALKLAWKDPVAGLRQTAELVQQTVARAWDELDRSRLRAVKDAEETATASAVSRDREAKLNESCMVCLDASPNIATLCCGTPVHLNCMAQWLAEAPEPTCITCRKAMPRPETRPPADRGPTSGVFGMPHLGMALPPDALFHLLMHRTVASMFAPPIPHDDTLSDTDTTTAADEAEPAQAAGQSRPRCGHGSCRHQAASGCANGSCGRCCQLYGPFACERHNTD